MMGSCRRKVHDRKNEDFCEEEREAEGSVEDGTVRMFC